VFIEYRITYAITDHKPLESLLNDPMSLLKT
jgi:hypothetical protein